MERIDLGDVNWTTLEMLVGLSESSILHLDRKKNELYKQPKLESQDLEILMKKYEELDLLSLDQVILPNAFLESKEQVKGYRTKWIQNSRNLSHLFLDSEEMDLHKLFGIINHSTQTLRKMHEKGMIIKDLSFQNIIVDEKDQHYFIDLDGCEYKEYKSPLTSRLFFDYKMRYQPQYSYQDPAVDRVMMFLELTKMIFGKPLWRVEKEEYDQIARQSKTVKRMYPYIMSMCKPYAKISDIPYLDKVIDEREKVKIKVAC